MRALGRVEVRKADAEPIRKGLLGDKISRTDRTF